MLDTKEFDLATTLVKEKMIDAEKVAHVQNSNPLEHALLVLTKTGYNAVPVLDFHGKFEGIISKSNILEAMFGVEKIEVEQLEKKTVSDCMDREIPTLLIDDTIEQALHELIDYNFVCVVDEDQQMQGIITRRQLLKEYRNEYYRTRNKS
ncbi:cyclic-di-AMP-binding protein CbpB [Alkalibacillus haloalkaliphilus]|uniref:cyclic-di-AMP-binding protein CbpB n=1 Tax=Alkalibacillus haloalkaliphilus TaxID=94136 RepID=UPI0029354DF7|nr:cyclic-di-AMP-binding protein CbpB [Alkalibacillus haloalkaliphilus]MDV2582299.1 cyclic-di-AMP-binding protein CbpB [Alkalibacillus haloalkaliphilus]